MANTIEMFLGTTALIVNTFVLMVMAFVGAIIYGPILAWANTALTTDPVIPMWTITWLPMATFGMLILYEIVLVIAFFVISGRRGTVDDQFG